MSVFLNLFCLTAPLVGYFNIWRDSGHFLKATRLRTIGPCSSWSWALMLYFRFCIKNNDILGCIIYNFDNLTQFQILFDFHTWLNRKLKARALRGETLTFVKMELFHPYLERSLPMTKTWVEWRFRDITLVTKYGFFSSEMFS